MSDVTRTSGLIGIVGGLGPAATVYYYNAVLGECARLDASPRLLLNNADGQLILNAVELRDTAAMADHLADLMKEMLAAGATTLAVSAIAPHMCMEELRARVPHPIVDPIDVLNRELSRSGAARIGLFGTRTTMITKLFGRAGVPVVDAEPSYVEEIHDLYLSIVRARSAAPNACARLRALAESFVRSQTLDALVLAGTDFAAVPKTVWSGLPVIDCARLHVLAIVEDALRQ